MSLFQPPTQTPEQLVTDQIDNRLRSTAQMLIASYNSVRHLIYDNPAFANPNDVYAAFQANTTTGLTPDQLGQAARAIKALINTFAPGTIVDEVPQATITY